MNKINECSGLNADVLDGIDSDRFSLKDECIQKGQDSMQIKKILPNSTPITSNIHSGSMYAKSSGVDFHSDHTIVKDLVLYWKMDESSGDIIKDYVASSNGVALSAPEIVSGNPGNARRFHGVKGQYIMKAHDAIIDFGRNNFTVSFKIKAGEPQNWTIIMGKANNLGINDTDFGWLFCNKGDVNGTDLEFVINPGDAGNRNNKSVSASNIFDNQWHHIAATRNHENIKLYVDGQLKDTTDGVIQSVHVESPLIIGAGMGDYVFSGTIDELAMWHRALTANEISELSDDGMYSKGLPIVDSALFFVNGEKRSRLDAWKSKGSDISFEDGKVGIGTNQPQTTLDVNGGVRVGRFTTATRPVCNDTIVGTFIFDTDKKKPFVCDGSLWKPLDSDYDEDGIVDWNDQDDNDPLVKDDQLKSENIKTGVEIFGVDGSYTNDATSLASDVKNGKSFYAGGQKVVGNMTVYETDQQATLVSNSDGRLKFRVPAGYFDGSLDVYGVDADLVSENIKDGINIFGIEGSYSPSAGIKADILVDISGLQTYSGATDIGLTIKPSIAQHQIGNNYYFLTLFQIKYDRISNYAGCSTNKCRMSLLHAYVTIFNSNTNQIQTYEKMSNFLVEYTIWSPNIKVCVNTIYFIQKSSDYYNNPSTSQWLQFSGTTFSEGSNSKNELPCEDSPNNNALIINSKQWNQKLDINTIYGNSISYIYRVFLTADNTN